jgi:hypothetical protein
MKLSGSGGCGGWISEPVQPVELGDRKPHCVASANAPPIAVACKQGKAGD